MNMISQIHPVMELPTPVRTSQRVRDRVGELALALGARIDV